MILDLIRILGVRHLYRFELFILLLLLLLINTGNFLSLWFRWCDSIAIVSLAFRFLGCSRRSDCKIILYKSLSSTFLNFICQVWRFFVLGLNLFHHQVFLFSRVFQIFVLRFHLVFLHTAEWLLFIHVLLDSFKIHGSQMWVWRRCLVWHKRVIGMDWGASFKL